jgi:hypothetical protein
MDNKIESEIPVLPNPVEMQVVLELESSKSMIRIGDNFTLIYRIINKSPGNITVLLHIVARNHCFNFYIQDMKEAYWGSNSIIDYNFNPGKDEFISLMPNQIFEAFVTIYFGEGPVYISTKRDYYNGLFFYLDKTDSYFFLEDAKEVKIEGIYFLTESEKKEIIKHGFEGAVLNKLLSDLVVNKLIWE